MLTHFSPCLPANLLLSIVERHTEGSMISCLCHCQPPGGPGGATTLIAMFKAGTGSGLVLSPGSQVLVLAPYLVLGVEQNCPVIACNVAEQVGLGLHHA